MSVIRGWATAWWPSSRTIALCIMGVWAKAAVPVILGVNGSPDLGEDMAEQEELDRA